MLSTLFATKPPLDDASIDWIFADFDWGLRHLDTETFFEHSVLVTPTNEHFPGRADSVHEMASLMFEASRDYAGMAAWPVRLMAPGTALLSTEPKARLPRPLRGGESVPAPMGDEAVIPIGYDPVLINNPGAMIAGFAQVLAHYLGQAVTEAPPAGVQNWPQTTEVLAVFLGFGVLMANTANEFRPRGCGSCGGPPAVRESFLSQFDLTYALALFCALKGIPTRAAVAHLKGPLRGYFKKCRRDLESRAAEIEALTSLRPPRD